MKDRAERRRWIVAALAFGLGAGSALAGVHELRSGHALLEIDGGTGAVVRLADTAAGGREYIAGGAGGDLVNFAVSGDGGDPAKLREFSCRQAGSVSVERVAGGLRVRYERIAGRGLGATCSIEPGEAGGFRFRVRIEGAKGEMLERVDCPSLLLRAPMEGDGAGDALVLGTTKGGVHERPHRWPVGRSVAAHQPGNLAAQFGCSYGPGGGVVTYCEDAIGESKDLSFARTKSAIALGWRHSILRDLGEGYDVPYPVVVGVFRSGSKGGCADWRDAAARYKGWATRQPWCARELERREDLPRWLLEGPAHVRFGRDWLAHPERIEGWLERYWGRQYPGVPLIVTFWGWEGVATWIPPKYFPPYPSEEGLRRCVDAVRRGGGHAFFWPSGYQWCLSYGKRADDTFEWEDRAGFEREARAHAMVDFRGDVTPQRYPWLSGGESVTLCRGDAWSRRWLTGVAVGLARRGAELVQIDQVVGAGMRNRGDCRSATHGHPPGPGRWDLEACHAQLEEMAAACRGAGVNMVLGFEEPQEFFLQRIGIQDYRDYEVATRSRQPGLRAESVFGHLYHEYVPLFQSNPRAGDRRMTSHCIVTGQVPHLVPHWPVDEHPWPMGGGFEEWDGDVPDGWEHVRGYKGKDYAGRPRRDGERVRSGAASLRIESAAGGEITQVSRNLPVGPGGLRVGGKYRFGVYHRADRLARGAGIGIAALGDGLVSRGSWRMPLREGADWVESASEVVVPPGADVVRVMIHLDGPCRVWLDDFGVSEIGADGVAKPMRNLGLPVEHDLYLPWVRLYHGEGRRYLQFGRSIAPPSIAPPGEVLAGAFRASDGSEAAILVNASDAAYRGELRWADGRRRDLALAPWEVRMSE